MDRRGTLYAQIGKEDKSGKYVPPSQDQFNFSTSIKGALHDDDEGEALTEKEIIQFQFESLRFSIPYMIYQRLGQWRLIDSIALNFHLITATVTLVLCANWQISLFMSFYLLCTVTLCVRAAMSLYRNGTSAQDDHIKQWSS